MMVRSKWGFEDGTHPEGVISFTPLLDLEINKLDFVLISASIDLIIKYGFTINF